MCSWHLPHENTYLAKTFPLMYLTPLKPSTAQIDCCHFYQRYITLRIIYFFKKKAISKTCLYLHIYSGSCWYHCIVCLCFIREGEGGGGAYLLKKHHLKEWQNHVTLLFVIFFIGVVCSHKTLEVLPSSHMSAALHLCYKGNDKH